MTGRRISLVAHSSCPAPPPLELGFVFETILCRPFHCHPQGAEDYILPAIPIDTTVQPVCWRGPRIIEQRVFLRRLFSRGLLCRHLHTPAKRAHQFGFCGLHCRFPQAAAAMGGELSLQCRMLSLPSGCRAHKRRLPARRGPVKAERIVVVPVERQAVRLARISARAQLRGAHLTRRARKKKSAPTR